MMLTITGYTVNYLCFLFLCVLMVYSIPVRERVDIIEQRIGVVETRMNYELAREMSLQQHFEDLNNSMIDLEEDHSNFAKSIDILKSSQLLLSLGLGQEKQWIRDQAKILSTQMGDHTDRTDRHFLELMNQFYLHTGQLTRRYSKLRADMIDKTEREQQWTKNQVKNLTSQVNEQTDQLNNSFSELRTELIGVNKEIKSDIYLKINKTDMLISSQQKEIEALKETLTNLASALIPTNLIKYVKYTCPSDWQTYSSYCYLFHEDKMTFSEARAYCKLQGATLPDIENLAEHSFIHNYREKPFYGQSVWIGYTDEEKEGIWISERTGLPASFTLFTNGKPYGGIQRNCVGMLTYPYSSEWFDMSCDGTLHGICKKDATLDLNL